MGDAWDYYFPWKTSSTKFLSGYETPFVLLLRMSYSRPRDIVVALNILKEEVLEKNNSIPKTFSANDLASHDFQTKYSEYLMGSIKDQLAFYYDSHDYELFLRFFGFLKGCAEFSYSSYLDAYNQFTEYIVSRQKNVPEFVESPDKFIQFLYESNIICYIDYLDKGSGNEPIFRFCYRERSISNISPKVGLEKTYRIHYGLWKALNVGRYEHK
jgi:effector-binding domain-containing protein